MDTNEDTLTLVEAVDTLSHIAELDLEKKFDVMDEESLGIDGNSLAYRTIYWIRKNDTKEAMPVLRNIFKIIHKYLQNFYQHEYSDHIKIETIEEIKSIMVLVGEAARKLDKMTHLFNKTQTKSVMKLKEYCDLQEFYRTRILRTIDDTAIGQWILEITKKGHLIQQGKNKIKPQNKTLLSDDHVFIDLETVKNDSVYELFFMRKEDGTRFYNPQLIRNIKLFGDFGVIFGRNQDQDPLTETEEVKSRVAHRTAKQILKDTRPVIDKFYRNAMKHKDTEAVTYTNDAIMALMMASNPSCNYKDHFVKNCSGYFSDFLKYLHKALSSFEYQRMIVYANKNSSSWSATLLDTLHSLCSSLYIQSEGMMELKNEIKKILELARDQVSESHSHNGCWSRLAGDYVAMTKFIHGHNNGPINIVLDILDKGEQLGFDPLSLGNLPSVEYEVLVGEKRYVIARWPTPTAQESINKVGVCEEFKGFLRDALVGNSHKNCLLVDFQDRLTWKEYYRAVALEGLCENKELASCVDTVTIAKNTDFYHQQDIYKNCNHTDTFINLFQEQLKEGSGGFWFPKEMVKNGNLHEFITSALEAINRVFFSSKNTLTIEHRKDFIEIFNLFLLMKLIDTSKPDVIGLCCKDAVDVSPAVAAELFVLLKLMHQDTLTKDDYDLLSWIVYAPAIFYRERLMLPERFNRMLSVIRMIESTQKQFGRDVFYKIIDEAFGYLMDDPLYKGMVLSLRGHK